VVPQPIIQLIVLFVLILQDRFLISNGIIIAHSTIPHQQAQSSCYRDFNHALCHCFNCLYAQGTSNLPTTPQPCTPIQAFLLKHEQIHILAMQLHKTYALGSFYIYLYILVQMNWYQASVGQKLCYNQIRCPSLCIYYQSKTDPIFGVVKLFISLQYSIIYMPH